jgi:hypothetical protein
MKYDDLLTVPYLKNGRALTGLDCYGLVIECFRRDGKVLKDLLLPAESSVAEHILSLNVKEVADPRPGMGVQFFINGHLHIGYMISRRMVLHMTESGIRETPLLAMPAGSVHYFEVVE